MKEENALLVEQNKELTSSLSDANTTINDLRKQLNDFSTQLAILRLNIKRLKQQYKDLKTKYDALNKTLLKLHADFEIYKGIIQSARFHSSAYWDFCRSQLKDANFHYYGDLEIALTPLPSDIVISTTNDERATDWYQKVAGYQAWQYLPIHSIVSNEGLIYAGTSWISHGYDPDPPNPQFAASGLVLTCKRGDLPVAWNLNRTEWALNNWSNRWHSIIEALQNLLGTVHIAMSGLEQSSEPGCQVTDNA